MALISDRIFELLNEKDISQKEFARKTEIAESTISDWKRRGCNPASEKILIISEVLGVSAESLLSGADSKGIRSNASDYMVITKDSEQGKLLECFDTLSRRDKDRLLGYLEGLTEK